MTYAPALSTRIAALSCMRRTGETATTLAHRDAELRRLERRHALAVVLDAYTAAVGPTDHDLFDDHIALPVSPLRTVKAYPPTEHRPVWSASLDDPDAPGIVYGPHSSALAADVVDWLRVCCDNLPDTDTDVIDYAVGLPVHLTIHSDGSVTVEVDFSELDDAIREHTDEAYRTDAGIRADVNSIRAAVLHGRVTLA